MTVQVTVVDPAGKVEPDGGVHETPATAQLSFTVGEGYVTAPEPPPLHSDPLATGMSAGHVMTGSSLSLIVTVKEHVAVLSHKSPASQLTEVVPFGNSEPLAGEHTTFTLLQLSLAVTV